jgi:hypothetical protein
MQSFFDIEALKNGSFTHKKPGSGLTPPSINVRMNKKPALKGGDPA